VGDVPLLASGWQPTSKSLPLDPMTSNRRIHLARPGQQQRASPEGSRRVIEQTSGGSSLVESCEYLS